MIFVLVLVLAVFYYMFKDDHKINFSSNQNNPEQKLKERYINGDIDEETYLKMKSVINGK
ncbi:MAG TPA: hypothetical protein VLM88_05750 [Proteiniclasticum sp.]|nr:hypothetical protein [Proteiniclasticum sp.]